MHNLLLNNVIFLNLTVAECVFYFFNASLVATFALTCAILYTTCRPRLPARVNCWFCNRSFWVPFASRNCFDCPHCDQYNGFTGDGDYNADVLARAKSVPSSSSQRQTQPPTNGLCGSCNTNQQLKVQQLASFTPMNEQCYDAEIQHYKEQLEKSYRLCDTCSLVLTQTLQSQQYDLLTQRLNGHCRLGSSGTQQTLSKHGRVRRALGASSTLCMAAVLGSVLPALSQQVPEEYTWIAQFFLTMLGVDWWPGSRAVAAVGTVLSMCLALGPWGRAAGRDKLCLAWWGAVQALAWSPYPTLLHLSAALGLALHLAPLTKPPKSKPDPLFAAASVKKPVSLTAVVQNSVRPKEITITKVQPIMREEPKKVKKLNQSEASVEPPRRIETRSQSIKKQGNGVDPKLSQQEKIPAEKPRSRLFSPPPEVYEGLRGLCLTPLDETQSGKTPGKPANYLFETINFGGKSKKASSVIKPAKFTLDSHQKSSNGLAKAAEPLRCSVPDPEPVPDVVDLNLTALSPPGAYHVDYDMGGYNHGPSFMGPMGHTTVYTYTRPAPGPTAFPFSPYGFQRFSPPYTQRFSPPYASYAPSCASPFSDRSDGYLPSQSGNASTWSSFQDCQRWVWLKRCLYATSAVLNVATMIFLACTYWRN